MKPSSTRKSSQQGAKEEIPGDIVVRALQTHAELDECVDLQRRIWGEDYKDIVPASVLKISQAVGGVAAGAIEDDGRVVGFVYGLTGVRDGRLTHWSHMLGVLASHRGQGIGQRLKLFQRQWVVDRGVREMRWTFDPLVSGNAHFNLNLLGARIDEYVEDMYAETGSGLHSFGTDRFIAHWDLTGTDDPPSMDGASSLDWEKAPVLDADPSAPDPAVPNHGSGLRGVRIEVPYDIMSINREDPAAALAWRRGTRAAFHAARREGYRIVGFRRGRRADRCHYLLAVPGDEP